MKFLRITALAATLFTAAIFAGCGSDNSSVTPAGYGRVQVSVTDAPGVNLTEISNLFVTFDRLVVFPFPDSIPPDSSDGGPDRIEVLTSPITFDLLSLTNGLSQALGQADIPPGHYRGIVIDLDPNGAWLIEADGDTQDVKVPSGRLFVKTDFTVEEGNQTDVVLDFDVAASLHLHQTGNGKYILNPVLRQLPPAEDAAKVSGSVFVQTDSGLVSVGDIMVPNPWRNHHGNDEGEGGRPGDHMGRGRGHDWRPLVVPLPVAWPMIVHAHVHGDTSDVEEGDDDGGDDDGGDNAAIRLGIKDHDEDGDDDVNRPHPRGTIVGPHGNYLVSHVRKGADYDMQLFFNPHAPFELVSGPGTITVNGDLTGQDFVIRRKPDSASN